MSNLTKSLLKGAKEAVQYSLGDKKNFCQHKIKVPQLVNVKEIRQQLNLNRNEFSKKFGFSIRTIEKWEQGVRNPDTAARAYLTVIAYNSSVVTQALSSQKQV